MLSAAYEPFVLDFVILNVVVLISIGKVLYAKMPLIIMPLLGLQDT